MGKYPVVRLTVILLPQSWAGGWLIHTSWSMLKLAVSSDTASEIGLISNNSSFSQKHLGVLNGSDGSDGT